MRQRPHQPPADIERKAGIRIQRDHEANRRQAREAAHFHRERGVLGAAQQAVELVELAAFALPAHPTRLRRVPDAFAMQQVKARLTVLIVQRGDHRRGRLDNGRVAGQRFRIGVGKVAEQREAQVLVVVGQRPHFQRVHQLAHALHGRQDRGHRHQRAEIVRHAVAKRQLRQPPRRNDRRQNGVQEGQRELADRDQRQHRHQRHQRPGAAVVARVLEEAGLEERRRQHDAAQIAQRGMLEGQPRDALTQGGRIAHRALEIEPAARNQVIADVMRAIEPGLLDARRFREGHGTLGDLDLIHVRSLRQLLHGLPIAIARLEVHAPVRAHRIVSEDPLDAADRFHKLRPVERRERAHRADDVGDRQLIDGFALLLAAQQLVGGLAARGQASLKPAPRRRRGHGLIAQAVKDLHHEGGGRLGRHLERRFAFRLGRFDQQLGRESPGGFALLLGTQRLHREPAEVLHQGQAQHDGDRPQLADRQRRDVLIGVRKPPQQLLIEASGRVRDEIARQDVHPRIPPPAAGRQRGQLFVVLARQVAPDLQHLRAHHVVVVAEPLLRRRLGGLREALFRQLLVGLFQPLRVALQAAEELFARAFVSRHAVIRRQGARMRLELLEGKGRLDAGEILVQLGKTGGGRRNGGWCAHEPTAVALKSSRTAPRSFQTAKRRFQVSSVTSSHC